MSNKDLARALGYRNKTEAVAGLTSKGFTRRQIGRKIGSSPKSVLGLLIHAKRLGLMEKGVSTSVEVQQSILTALGSAAAKRGVTAHELVQQLLAVIAHENMADAVLDDQAEVAE